MESQTNQITVRTERTTDDLGRALQGVLKRVKAKSIRTVESFTGALSDLDDTAAIEVIADGQSLVGGQWAVQVHVFDRGRFREVNLVALGDTDSGRARTGARNSPSLSSSIKNRDEIASALR